MSKPRALVIGCSLSGLLTANLLRTIGWDVDILNARAAISLDEGPGLVRRPTCSMSCARLGFRIDRSMWTEVHSHVWPRPKR